MDWKQNRRRLEWMDSFQCCVYWLSGDKDQRIFSFSLRNRSNVNEPLKSSKCFFRFYKINQWEYYGLLRFVHRSESYIAQNMTQMSVLVKEFFRLGLFHTLVATTISGLQNAFALWTQFIAMVPFLTSTTDEVCSIGFYLVVHSLIGHLRPHLHQESVSMLRWRLLHSSHWN